MGQFSNFVEVSQIHPDVVNWVYRVQTAGGAQPSQKTVNVLNNINYDPTFALGSDIDGNQNVLVVGWRGISGNSANSSVSLMWREL